MSLGHTFDEPIHNLMLTLYSATGDYIQTMKLFSSLKDPEYNLYKRIFHLIRLRTITGPEWRRVETLNERYNLPTPEVLLKQMRARGFLPSIYIYNVVVRDKCKRNEFKDLNT